MDAMKERINSILYKEFQLNPKFISDVVFAMKKDSLAKVLSYFVEVPMPEENDDARESYISTAEYVMAELGAIELLIASLEVPYNISLAIMAMEEIDRDSISDEERAKLSELQGDLPNFADIQNDLIPLLSSLTGVYAPNPVVDIGGNVEDVFANWD
jgi:hypothetical protein